MAECLGFAKNVNILLKMRVDIPIVIVLPAAAGIQLLKSLE